MIVGCGSQSVLDINSNPEQYLGKKVTVSGEVVAPLKIGTMSGFTLREGDSSIVISSETLPDAKKKVRVRGTLVKGLFSQHYIYADSVQELP